ncbi:hypothetical protein LI017_17035, partial [Clostridium perfringens]|nr:hypothetical protein [Clostridium perfringens]
TCTVVYEVTDNQGATSTKTITVTVLSNDAPVISGTDNISIKEGDAFDPMAGVTATDATDKTIKVGDTFDPMAGVTAEDKE